MKKNIKKVTYGALAVTMMLPLGSTSIKAAVENNSASHVELSKLQNKKVSTSTNQQNSNAASQSNVDAPSLTFAQFEADANGAQQYFSKSLWETVASYVGNYRYNNDVIPQSAFDKIYMLNQTISRIDSTKGVEYLHGLAQVDLRNGNTDTLTQEDFDRFAEVPTISYFTASGNVNLENIDFLKGMDGLTSVDIDNTSVSDLSPLAESGLKSSKHATLYASHLNQFDKDGDGFADGNGVDESSLKNILGIHFVTLNLNYDNITDNGVEILSGLTPLLVGVTYPEFSLGLNGNNIYDVSPLGKIAFDKEKMNKINVYVQDNHILDISPLTNFTTDASLNHVDGRNQYINLNDPHFNGKYDEYINHKYVFPTITELDGKTIMESTNEPTNTFRKTSNSDGTHSYEWFTQGKKTFQFQSDAGDTSGSDLQFDGSIEQTIGDKPAADKNSVTAHFVLNDKNGEKLSDDKITTGQTGDSYSLDYGTSMKTIAKDGKVYDLKSIDGKESGTFTDVNQDVYYIYSLRDDGTPAEDAAPVHVVYVDEAGNKISDGYDITGKVGDKKSADKKNISGYTFKEFQDADDKDGNVTLGDKERTIKVVYTKSSDDNNNGGNGDDNGNGQKPGDNGNNNGKNTDPKTNNNVTKNVTQNLSRRLPQTGENLRNAGFLTLIGIGLVSLAGYYVLNKKKSVK
ncbi:MucBP domain-containing protein [Lactobacillus sp. YT155]|uniref:MucBP domain-containing protein n=1 Tax=Lactobacillus sp. YT155 TaxID=3060955 RepID=UPI00265FD016|nr:MucBP domain-containing protein [Lactobacillus sp. YT155]MDO1605323.1 MucBP domain-containing protein [Lactobacillus sp. YT155]